jgi:hypothetical protein
VRQFGSTEDDEVGDIAAASGRVVVTGSVEEALPGQTFLGGDQDAFVASFPKSGAAATYVHEIGTDDYDYGESVVVASNGDTYVAMESAGELGAFVNADGHTDAYVSKFTKAGAHVWDAQFHSNDDDGDLSLAVGSSTFGVAIAGSTGGTLPGQTNAGGTDGFVARITSTGVVFNVRQFGTTTDEFVSGVGMLPGNVMAVGGTTEGAFTGFAEAGDNDAFIITFPGITGI